MNGHELCSSLASILKSPTSHLVGDQSRKRMHVGSQLNGLLRKLSPFVVSTQNKIGECHTVPGYSASVGHGVKRQAMNEALDRPFRLMAHQCDPSPMVPSPCIVGI